MKRVNNIYQQIISIDNLMLADAIAQKGKSSQYGVILHNKNKEQNILSLLLAEITNYLANWLKLTVKENYQVFPVAQRGIDFVGYKFYHTHTMLRKSIKKNFTRMLAKRKNPASIASYIGWAKHCNSKHLLKKLLA